MGISLEEMIRIHLSRRLAQGAKKQTKLIIQFSKKSGNDPNNLHA